MSIYYRIFTVALTVLTFATLLFMMFWSLGLYVGSFLVFVLAAGYVERTLRYLSALDPTFLPSLRFEDRRGELFIGGSPVIGCCLDRDLLVIVYLSVTDNWGLDIVSTPSIRVIEKVEGSNCRRIDKSKVSSLFEIIMTPDMLSKKDQEALKKCRSNLRKLGCDCDMIFRELPKSCILDEEGQNLYHHIFNIMKNYPLLTDHVLSGFAWLGECEHRSLQEVR